MHQTPYREKSECLFLSWHGIFQEKGCISIRKSHFKGGGPIVRFKDKRVFSQWKRLKAHICYLLDLIISFNASNKENPIMQQEPIFIECRYYPNILLEVGIIKIMTLPYSNKGGRSSMNLLHSLLLCFCIDLKLVFK